MPDCSISETCFSISSFNAGLYLYCRTALEEHLEPEGCDGHKVTGAAQWVLEKGQRTHREVVELPEEHQQCRMS